MDLATELIARLDNLRFLLIVVIVGIVALVVRAFSGKE